LIEFEINSEIEVISCSELSHNNSNKQLTVTEDDQSMKLS